MALLDSNMADYGEGFLELAGIADSVSMAIKGITDATDDALNVSNSLNTLRPSERGGRLKDLNLFANREEIKIEKLLTILWMGI